MVIYKLSIKLEALVDFTAKTSLKILKMIIIYEKCWLTKICQYMMSYVMFQIVKQPGRSHFLNRTTEPSTILEN